MTVVTGGLSLVDDRLAVAAVVCAMKSFVAGTDSYVLCALMTVSEVEAEFVESAFAGCIFEQWAMSQCGKELTHLLIA